MAKGARSGALVLVLSLVLALIPYLGPAADADVIRDREWGLRAMHGQQAWKYSRGGHVTVAVLDTGVFPSNPDLVGRVDTGPDYTHSERGPSSPYWGKHGTAMASIIAGHGDGPDGENGVIGVAPKAKILSIRVTLEANDPLRRDRTALNRTRYALANGIRYATDHGASIISMSLGGGTSSYNGSDSERSAIAYAQSKGVLLVASAGNDGAKGNRRTFPAAYDGVLAVGAVGRKLHRAPFSNSQPYVRVLAPGVGIVTAGGQVGYASTTGTSASTAFVAGTAALVRSRYRKLPAPVVTQALRQGTGRADTLDARRALLAAAKLKKAREGGPPTPMATDKPAVTAEPADQSLLYGGIGGGALLVAILAAVAVVVMRRRRRAEAAIAEANGEWPGRIDVGAVPPPVGAGRMPRRPAESQFAAFTAAGGATPNGNGHGPIPRLNPYGPGPEAEPYGPGPEAGPYRPGGPGAGPYGPDVEPYGPGPEAGPYKPGPGAEPYGPDVEPSRPGPEVGPYGPVPEGGPYGPGTAPFPEAHSAPTPEAPAPPAPPVPGERPAPPAPAEASAPPASGEASASVDAPPEASAFGPRTPFRTGSGPQIPHDEDDSEHQTAFTAEAMAPPPPLPPEPGQAEPIRQDRPDQQARTAEPAEQTKRSKHAEPAERTERAAPESPDEQPPPLPPPGTPPPPPPPTVETPAPPADPRRPYASTGSVWDTPKLWAGSDTSAISPFEAEARNAEAPGTGPYTERGTTGWATAAGWENATRPGDTDGDDEEDRHL